MHALPSMAAARRRSGSGLTCLVTAGLCWGTGGLIGSLLTRAGGLAPITVAAYRLAGGGVVILALLVVSGRRLPRGRAAWNRILTVGVLAAVFQTSYFTSVSLTSVSLSTLITIGASPLLVLVAERITGRRRIDGWVIITITLSLAGLALLVGLPSGGFSTGAILGSAGTAVLASAGFSAMTLLGSRPVPGLDDLTTIGAGFTLAGLLLAPIAAGTAGLTFRPDPATSALLVALAVVPTALAYTMYFRGLRSVSATTAAVMSLLEPLTAAVLAALVLGDRLGTTGIVGAILLAGAVVLAARTSSATVDRPVAGA
jgi:drug/metabolite transporter, DME family